MTRRVTNCLRYGSRLLRGRVLAAEGSAAAETRRLCDRRVTYDIVPPADVPASLSILSGVWKGTIIMAGGSEMCVSMVVKEVFPDGRVILADDLEYLDRRP